MSPIGKPFHELGANRFHESCTLNDDDHNKPDFKQLDLGTATTLPTPKTPLPHRSNGAPPFTSSHSGELRSGSSVPATPKSKPIHRRSSSTGAPLIYSGSTGINSSSTSGTSSSSSSSGGGGSGSGSGSVGSNFASVSGNGDGSGSSVSSTTRGNLYPSGNICPFGKVLKSNMGSRGFGRAEKLGLGTGNYGHGSIIKGGGKSDCNSARNGNANLVAGELGLKRAMMSCDQEEVKNAGNELYKRGNFEEALLLYDRAISISPENAACRSNRAAALTMLGRFGEAVIECEEAVRLNPGYMRAHQRLASLYLRLGQVENARHHLFHGQQSDTTELQKLHLLEKHINKCSDARKIRDWKGLLRECEAAIIAGAVSSPQVIASKAEAFLKLQQLEEAESVLSDLPKLEPYPPACSQVKFFGMFSEAYVLYVRAQVDMALGRFDSAAPAAEKAALIDYGNIEISTFLKNVKLIARARARGKDLFSSGRYSEACSAYGEGLKYNLSNAVLYCNRAVCWSKLGLWEQSVEDCNQALKVQPNYTKALLRRAASNAKLERWAESVRDYEILRKELPGDNEVVESLCQAQDALRKFHHAESSGPVRAVALMSSPGGCGAQPST